MVIRKLITAAIVPLNIMVNNIYKSLATILVITAVVGGYMSLNSGQSEPTHVVTLHNEDETAHRVSIDIVGSNDDLVLSETRRISPGEKWNVTKQTEPGNYTIQVTISSGASDKKDYKLPLIDGNKKSFATVYIRSEEDVSTQVYWQD